MTSCRLNNLFLLDTHIDKDMIHLICVKYLEFVKHIASMLYCIASYVAVYVVLFAVA